MPERWLERLKSRNVACALWIAASFALASAVYLSWLSRLVTLLGSGAADWTSMVAGYLFQAAGMGLAVTMLRREDGADLKRRFTPAMLGFAVVSAPALISDSPAAAIIFGLLMNLMYGVFAGYYLYAAAAFIDAERRGLVFGGGYALSTVLVGLLALIGGGSLLRGRGALLIYLPAAVAIAPFTARLDRALRDRPAQSHEPASQLERRDLALLCGAVFLISLVKNLGYSFPSADIEAGLIPELSRVPYAVGLFAAGLIADRERKKGMLCAAAALVLPFLMLGLSREPVPSTICWGLDYLFFGFFSVFRAVLFLDAAAKSRNWALAPMGLLMGRLGDAAGSALGLVLADQRIALIALTAILFFPAVWLLYRLYQKLYVPEAVQQRSEQEVFEMFCLHNDLSSREKEVLRMVLADRTNGEIAEALFITESTVKYHVHNTLQKTGCKNRGDLLRKYTAALYPHMQS